MMERFKTRQALLVAPPLLLGVVAATALSGLDVLPRVVVYIVAFVAAVTAAWVAGSQASEGGAVITAMSGGGEAAPIIIADRRRPIYDRESGLFQHWYFRLRVEEEIVRADRFNQPFTMLRVTSEDPATMDAARKAIKRATRSVDLASDLGDALGLVLPNTPKANADPVMERLRQAAPTAVVVATGYPQDGTTYGQLFGEPEWYSTAAA
jgi:hypothetical protein